MSSLAGPEPRRVTLPLFDPGLLAESVCDADFEHRQLHLGPFGAS
jgi:hypothetical protein